MQIKVNPELEGVKDAFIEECFVHTADKDYITARLCYRTGLFENFLWCSQQCIEKYIKGILLYNDMSTKPMGHDLKKGMQFVCKIPDINWSFDGDFKWFVEEYLNFYGLIRYFEEPVRVPFPVSEFTKWTRKNGKGNVNDYFAFRCSAAYKKSNILNQLDNSVWQIRRYCFNMPFWRENHMPVFSARMGFILDDSTKNNPCKLKPDGYLREVQSGKHGVHQKTALLWKNRYFAFRNRREGGTDIKHFEKMPPHLRYTKLIEDQWFKKNVIVSKRFKNALKQELGINL